MASKTRLINIPSEALGIVADFCDALSLHELFKSGDRILISKLIAPHGVSRYTNLNDYNQESKWSASLVKKFKGLRKLELFSYCGSLGPSHKFLEVVSPTLEEIALHSVSSQYIWYANGKPSGFNFATSCPRLRSLSLLNSRKRLESLEERPETEWLKDHGLLLPPTLTCLRLDLDFTGLDDEVLSYLPTQLEELTLCVFGVQGIEWLFQFPHLQVLDLRTRGGPWVLSEHEIDDYAIERNKKGPTKIRKFSLGTIRIEDKFRKGFFSYFYNVEELNVPYWKMVLKEMGGLVNLKSLTCAVPSPDDLRVISPTSPLFPPTITALYLVHGTPSQASSDSWFARLPPNLRTFHYHGSSSVEDLSLLPRTLTHLVFTQSFFVHPSAGKLPADDVSTWVAKLPPNLTTLKLPVESCNERVLFDRLPSLRTLQPLLSTGLHPPKPWHIHAAFQSPQGIPTLSTFLHEYGQAQLMTILASVISYRDSEKPITTVLHPDVFYWLRMRGLLSNPASIGVVNDLTLMMTAINHLQPEFLLLALPYCPPHDWLDIAPYFEDFAQNKLVPVLEWLFQNGYEFHYLDNNRTFSRFVKAARRDQQFLALNWFKDQYGNSLSANTSSRK